jgi:hypothetical protein
MKQADNDIRVAVPREGVASLTEDITQGLEKYDRVSH